MRRNTLTVCAVLATVLAMAPLAARADITMMSGDWAEGMCEAWNAEPGLTENLDGWIDNDADRGYKLMRIYRRDCPDSPWIEMKTAKTEDGVMCVESGWATDEELTGSDYVMFADTNRWQEMGAGEYGPMKGMMTGRLKFEGPKFEAMRNMGPFSNFLLLVGKVPGDVDSCPELPAEQPEAETDLPAEEEVAEEGAEEMAHEMSDEVADEAPEGTAEDGDDGGDGR